MQTRRLSHWYPRRFNSRPALNDTGRRGAELRPRSCGFGYNIRTPHEQTNAVTETKTMEKKNKDTEDLQGGLWGGRAPQGARLLWSLEKAKHHTGDVRACVCVRVVGMQLHRCERQQNMTQAEPLHTCCYVKNTTYYLSWVALSSAWFRSCVWTERLTLDALRTQERLSLSAKTHKSECGCTVKKYQKWFIRGEKKHCGFTPGSDHSTANVLARLISQLSLSN